MDQKDDPGRLKDLALVAKPEFRRRFPWFFYRITEYGSRGQVKRRSCSLPGRLKNRFAVSFCALKI